MRFALPARATPDSVRALIGSRYGSFFAFKQMA
jgi:hypothetical protein